MDHVRQIVSPGEGSALVLRLCLILSLRLVGINLRQRLVSRQDQPQLVVTPMVIIL